MIERITVDEVGRAYPLWFSFVEVPLNRVRELPRGVRNLRTNHFTTKILSKPPLFLTSTSAVTNPKVGCAQMFLDVRGEESNILLRRPDFENLALVSFCLNPLIAFIVERTIIPHVRVQGVATIRIV